MDFYVAEQEDPTKRVMVRRAVPQFPEIHESLIRGQVDSIDEAIALAIPQSHGVPLEIWVRQEDGLRVLHWIVWRGVVYRKTWLNGGVT